MKDYHMGFIKSSIRKSSSGPNMKRTQRGETAYNKRAKLAEIQIEALLPPKSHLWISMGKGPDICSS